MAAFKTHLTGGALAGALFAYTGYMTFHLNIPQTFSVFIMGCVGGILPDLDSDTGKPLELLCNVVSVLIPALFLDRITRLLHPMSPELLVCYFVCSYLLINYPLCTLIKKFTIHRGIIHSIPCSVLFGELTYLLFLSSGKRLATLLGITVFAGCIVHLLLDECNSVTFRFGFIPRLKKSSGSALKLASENYYLTALVYGLIVLIGSGVACNFHL